MGKEMSRAEEIDQTEEIEGMDWEASPPPSPSP